MAGPESILHAGVCTRTRRRRGAVYLIVLAVAANVLVIALGAIALGRVRLARIQGQQELNEARLLASSAVAQAVGLMNSPDTNDTWRQDYTSGVENTPVAFGNGQIAFTLTDEDGDLSDDAWDPVWIDGKGTVGSAVWVERAQARIDGGLPLECLRTALHSSGDIDIFLGHILTVSGGPVSTDAELVILGFIYGDVEAATISGVGIISGTITVPADFKGMPAKSLFTDYRARATVLTFNGDLDTMVLTPGVNEYGGTLNADGVYYIDTGGMDIIVTDSRLWGTLLINAGAGTVTFDTANLMEPFRTDFPVLIIKGQLSSKLKDAALGEGLNGHNYNPPGATYNGVTDSDQTDTYPNEIHGLVHVIGNATLDDIGSQYRSVLLVDGSVEVTKTPTIIFGPNLMDDPPLGYTDDPNSTKMIVKQSTWTRQPAP